MKRFIHRNIWLLTGAFVLVAAPVAANTMQLFTDFKLSRLIPGLEPKAEQAISPVIVIERERITLPVNGQQVVEGTGIHAPPTPAAAATPCDGIRAVGEHAYEIPLAEMRAAHANMDDLSQQVRIVPAFREGQSQGLKLFAIRPDSIFTKLGLQNGDVIQRVNGQSLKNPEGALSAYENLRAARHIEVDLERGGTPLRKVYDVR